MPTRKSAISSNVYVAFRSLPKKGWSEVVRLFENKREEITLLSIPKQLDILHMYVESLFELKGHRQIKEEVDQLIYLSLSEEIPVQVGRPYYEDALFWKANAAMHLMEYKESRHILEQLIRINPERKECARKLVKCMYWDKPGYISHFKACAVLLFFISALVIIIEILVIKSFYYNQLETVMLIRNILFMSALSIVGLVELIHWAWCEWKVSKLTR